MWTPATRKNYSRNGLRYQSDVTDEEWRVIESFSAPSVAALRFLANPLRFVSALYRPLAREAAI